MEFLSVMHANDCRALMHSVQRELRSMGSVNVQGRLAPSPFCGIVPKQEQF
jgi:hypothetical protein